MSILGTLQTKDYAHFTVQPTDHTQPAYSFEATSAEQTGRAFPGDIVSYNPETGCVEQVLKSCPGRASHFFLVGTLELASKTRYGMTSRKVPLYRFQAYASGFPPFFVGCSEPDRRYNLLVRIQYEGWPAGSTCPRGILVQTFGHAGDLKAEEEALLWEHCPAHWKASDIRGETVETPSVLPPGPIIDCFHIDPPGCRDIDDAISLEENRAQGFIRIGIHITNVAAWLLTNPWLAGKAEAIGQTFYRRGTAMRPVFPLRFSEGEFSLLPGKERTAISLFLTWSVEEKKFVGEATWELTRICVRESHTYESAAAATWAPKLQELCSALAKKKLGDSHEWVETLMVHYNAAVASKLLQSGKGVLRAHEGPDLERLERCKALGLPAEILAMRAGKYCSPVESGSAFHWGLGLQGYCHASSPIRRWCDCLNQIALLESLGWIEASSSTLTTQQAIEWLNRRSKAAKSYERDLEFLHLLVGPSAEKAIDAILVDDSHIWIPTWGRLQKYKSPDEISPLPGSSLRLKVFCDPTQRNWKRRLVLQIV